MRRTKSAAAFILLIGIWLALFFTLTLFTELIMAPWDTAIDIPPVGTPERAFNDFFDFSLGKYLLSIPLVGLSVGVTILMYRRNPHSLWHFAAGHAIFVGLLWVLFMIASAINNQLLYPYPPVLYDPNYRGYHRSVFPMSVILVACAGWILWQHRTERKLSAQAA